MILMNLLSFILVLAGTIFFIAGTVGILRFPDLHCRLHAITKADNLGLGFIVLALMLQSDSLLAAGKLLMIWLLALLVSANSCLLIGRWALPKKVKELHNG